MRKIFIAIGNSITSFFGRGERKARLIEIEGSQTPQAKGKAKRMKAEKVRKENLSRMGSVSTEGIDLDDL